MTLSISSSLLVSAANICNLIHPDITNVALFCTDATPGVDLERLLVKPSRQLSLSNHRSHNSWIEVTIGRTYVSVGNWLGYGCWEERRARIHVSLSQHMTDTTWHSLIAAIIAAFGSNFQEATSLEFGMGLDLTVSDSEESLLLGLLRKSESAELSLRLVHIHHSATNRDAFNVSPFEDIEAETERNLRILFSSLRKLKPWSQIDVD